MNPQNTIMEQFRVIEDAVRDLKEMIDKPTYQKEEEKFFNNLMGNNISNNYPPDMNSFREKELGIED